MAGISLLRPQYSSLGTVGVRHAHAGRQVAHETDQSEITGVSEGRANSGQDEVGVQEAALHSFEQHSQQDDRPSEKGDPSTTPANATTTRAAGGEFHVDPHLPPPERMAPAALLVEAPLPMFERLRVAAAAYNVSRDILRDARIKPGNGFDAAS